MKVLFIAGFGSANEVIYGGQVSASKGILSSPLASKAELILLDSTMKSIPPPSIYKRFQGAIARGIKFLKALGYYRPDVVLIFASDGLSFVEKAILAFIASFLGAGVVFRMSGGALPDQCRSSRIMRFFVRFTIRHCHRLICQSESWKNFFKDYGMDERKGIIIRNWIEDRPFYGVPCAAETEGPVNLLFLGWVEKSKGVYELVEAINSLLPYHPEVRTVIAGRGSELENLRRTLKERNLENKVYLPGWVNGQEKLELLRKSQVFVLPTYFEGLPNALLEAMAAGAAVVTTPVGGIPEVVLQGENGFLVPPRDSASLSHSLSILITDPSIRLAMGMRNREKIKEEFSLSKNWKLVAGALNEAAELTGRKTLISLN